MIKYALICCIKRVLKKPEISDFPDESPNYTNQRTLEVFQNPLFKKRSIY